MNKKFNIAYFRFNVVFVIYSLFIVLIFTSCTNSSSSQAPVTNSSVSNETDGNGKTYDGKIRIVHHYSANEKLYCHNIEIPKNILYRKTEANDSWYLIVNKADCKQEEAVHVDQQVIYDDALKTASLNGQSYFAPKNLKVIASEDANLPDINLLDGLCLDINGLCSLKAAVDQASYIAATAEVRIEVSAGLYKIREALQFHLPKAYNGHQVYLSGEDKLTTIIDAQKLSSHIQVDGSSGGLNISNLTFKNGSRRTAFSSSSIFPYNFGGILNIEKSIFEDNSGESVIYAGTGNLGLNIRKTVFRNNQTSMNTGTISVFSTPTLIEDTQISNNSGIGFQIKNKTNEVRVRNSTINDNGSLAVSSYQCQNCSIENSTITNNKYGLLLTTTYNGNSASQLSFNILNSTIVNNGDAEFGNLNTNFNQAETQVWLTNTVLANGNTGSRFNCMNLGIYPALQAKNNLIDDTSCSVTSGGNIIGIDPLLSSLLDYGGYTPTLLPLAGSPLIDHADSSSCLARDQRGYVRSGTCDIGAVEVQ